MQQGQANCVKYLCQRTQTNYKSDFEICIFPRIETRKSIKLHIVHVYFINKSRVGHLLSAPSDRFQLHQVRKAYHRDHT